MSDELADLRRRIDALDDQILELLDRRAAIAVQIGRAKRGAPSLHDPEREQRVLARLEAAQAARSDATFPRGSVRAVFREVMSACLSLEQAQAVAFLGPPGTFTHMAARAAFGLAAKYVETSTIAGVFDAVARGTTSYGVVPIENSTEGGVTSTLDGFLEYDVHIRGELVLDVGQCLLARHEEFGRIERVYSHPQGLGQCRRWLAQHLPGAQLVVSTSTSAAAREAADDDTSAAVASKLSAELFGLVVVRENIQDRRENATRFVLLAPDDAPRTGTDKTSVVFSAPHERGALKRVLGIFDEEGINLSRIESRPSGHKLWEYVFFTDLEGHRTDEAVGRALARLGALCELVRVLGSYPRVQG